MMDEEIIIHLAKKTFILQGFLQIKGNSWKILENTTYILGTSIIKYI